MSRTSTLPLPPTTTWLHDVTTVTVRELRPTLRDPFSLIFTLVQPLALLGLFAPMLGGMGGETQAWMPVPDGGGDASTLQWFVPGVLVMLGVFGTGMVGYALLTEMQSGTHERLIISPLRRSALVVGRAVKELAPITAQGVLILLVAIPFGFELHPLHAVLALALLGLLGIGIGGLSYALALAVKEQDWIFWAVTQTLTFPLLILSGLLLPLETAPGWMRTVAAANPLTYVVDALRALFAGQVPIDVVGFGVAAAAGTVVVGLVLGVRAMHRIAD